MPVARHPSRGAFWLAFTIAVLAFAIAGCGSSSNDKTSSSSSAPAASTSTAAAPAAPADAPPPQPAVAPRSGGSGTPIKIAIMSECKGAFGSFDNQNMAGAVSALSQFAGAKPKNPNKPRDGFTGGAINGHPLKLVGVGCGDDTSDTAIKETRRLMEQLDADVMIGPLSGDESIAIANYAKQHPDKTFVDGAAGAQDTTLKVQAPNFFRFNGDGAQWNAGLGDVAGDALADAGAREVDALAAAREQLAAEGDRDDLVALDHRDPAVVIVDQQPELVGDHLADLAHVVEPVQLPGQALQHLQVRDRAHVAAARGLGFRALARLFVEEHDLVLATRLGGHHRGLGARHQLARVHRVLGAL